MHEILCSRHSRESGNPATWVIAGERPTSLGPRLRGTTEEARDRHIRRGYNALTIDNQASVEPKMLWSRRSVAQPLAQRTAMLEACGPFHIVRYGLGALVIPPLELGWLVSEAREVVSRFGDTAATVCFFGLAATRRATRQNAASPTYHSSGRSASAV